MKKSRSLKSARALLSAPKTLLFGLLLIMFCLALSPANSRNSAHARNSCFLACQRELFDCMNQQTQPMCEELFNACVQACE